MNDYERTQIDGMRNMGRLMQQKPKYELLKDLPDAPAGTILDPMDMNETGGYRHLLFTQEYMDRTPEWFRKIKEETLQDAVESRCRYPPVSFISIGSRI